MSDLPNNVTALSDNWTLALMRNGIIVGLKISRWRGTTRLTPDTLGIKFTDEDAHAFARKYLSFGHQKLLPPEINREFESIERRARELLNLYSFDTVWGKFVPITAFQSWETQNEELKKEYMDLAKQFGNGFDRIVSTVKSDYKNLAKDVWARLYPDNGGNPTDSFVETFSNNIVSKIPDVMQIMSNFKYETVYSFIPMPSFIEKELDVVRDIQRERDVKDHNARLKVETEERIAAIYVEKKKELIEGFLDSTVNAMRNYVRELCDEVLVSLGKTRSKSKIPDSQVKKLKKMIQRVRVLNFYDDKQIDDHFNELEFEIDKFQCDMSKDVVVRKLEEIVEVAKKEINHTDFNPAIGYLEV
jgi:hypothetical protein